MIEQKKTALRLTRAQRGYPSNEPPQTFGESEMKDFTPHINPNRACNVAAVGGILHPFGAFTECRRGNLLHIGERIAAPHHRGVFFLAFRSRVVPLTAATCKPLRRAVSYMAVSNLHGAAYPVERVRGSRKHIGIAIMSTFSKAQCIRAQRVQTTLNHLRATARAVRSAVNPYASLDRVPSLSEVLRDAAKDRCKLLRCAFNLTGEV